MFLLPPLPDPPALALGDLDLAALQAAVMAEAQDAVLGALAGGAVRRTRRSVDSPVALVPEQSRVMDPIVDGPYVWLLMRGRMTSLMDVLDGFMCWHVFVDWYPQSWLYLSNWATWVISTLTRSSLMTRPIFTFERTN